MHYTLDFETISNRLKQMPLPEIDLVVGIAAGGIVPASLIAHQLDKPMTLIHINHRDEADVPRHTGPKLMTSPKLPAAPSHILLVDDVSYTGQTFALARAQLAGHEVTTFAMRGKADYVAFPELDDQVDWAWKIAAPSARDVDD